MAYCSCGQLKTASASVKSSREHTHPQFCITAISEAHTIVCTDMSVWSQTECMHVHVGFNTELLNALVTLNKRCSRTYMFTYIVDV